MVWFPAFIFAFASTLTPGPNNIMLLASGLNYGAQRTVPHAFGIILGFPVMVLAVGLGLGQLFTTYPAMHRIIQFAGISYLLFLAWKVATADTQYETRPSTQPLTFFQAALFQWINPKAWIMAVGSVSAFTTVGQGVLNQVLLLSTFFFIACLFSTSLWTLCGVALSQLLKRPRQRRYFNWLMGLLLVGSVLPLLWL